MNRECSTSLLQSALEGKLAGEEEEFLTRHLEECEACSNAIEEMAGGPNLCQEAARLLLGDERDTALSNRDEWSEVDFTVEHLEPADDPNVLGRMGDYDILEFVGRGGMGIVLKGYDHQLKRCVAIKVLAPQLAQSSQAKKRFAREAQAAAAIVHPHVLAIHHVQSSGLLPFFVMPLVSGESLAHRLTTKGALALVEVLRIGMQAAAGLAAAHEQGLVHRDVKPANILLEKGVERAVLTDFGLARAADDVALTRWGIIAGTPQYMSPEQAQGEALDGRSDLFSLGCVLYEMATGVSPFRADSTMATLRRLIDDAPPAMSSLNPELPAWFIAIVDRLLEKDRSRRFSTAKEVSELLEGCLAHLQQPASVPLPEVVLFSKPAARATARNSRWRSSRRIGPIVVACLIAIGGAGAFMMASAEPTDISGHWTGEGWNKVILEQIDPGKYEGTYTDTFGNQPGKIELAWSRIERQYKGRWSEGKDRFGKIAARLVGDEIRGAWTADRKSRVNPGTPELADLTWVRANPDAGKQDARPHRWATELNCPSLKTRYSSSEGQHASTSRCIDCHAGYDKEDKQSHRDATALPRGLTALSEKNLDSAFTHRVPFEVGATRFCDGDRITIEWVSGTAEAMAGGNMYVVKGSYRLASHDEATLAAFVTDDSKTSEPSIMRLNRMQVGRGEGQFILVLHMRHDGKPHISFYPASGGEGFGHVYFGTGDTVLKKGWWEKSDAHSRAAASKRQRFEPVVGKADETSWAVFPPPSIFNKHDWAVMARMTIGGEALITLPDDKQPRCQITLLKGNDEAITVQVQDAAKKSRVVVSIARDQSAEVTVDGAGYKVRYPSVEVSLKDDDSSPFAQVIVTRVEEREADGAAPAPAPAK